ncbi:GNAT family N-acetyltransferase [candidate division KSB1 bacterium]|nr:GNAT family N-acetyltransferase [candidate division KSB1 bacterium]
MILTALKNKQYNPQIFSSSTLLKEEIWNDSALEKTLSQNGLQPFFELGEQLTKSKAKDRQLLFNFLNLARSNALLKQIYQENKQNDWFDLCLKIIEKSNFTLSRLFHQRVEQYNVKTLFQEIQGKEITEHWWLDINEKVNDIARGLLSLSKNSNSGPVAILSENSLEMVCIDLACLMTGIVNVPIPANSTAESVTYILNHSKAATIFVSTEKQLQKVLKTRSQLKNLQNIVIIKHTEDSSNTEIISFTQFIKQGIGVSDADLESAFEQVKLSDLATIMYTSGTTEAPKGIMFSHLNIISKRFARAIALPEIGADDTFLCYLPLYHTFGRYFEMMGCIFWGCTYAFMEGPGIDTLIGNMQLVKPTVFISIPQKWIQLYEKIQEDVDIDTAPHSEIQGVVAKLTGGKLKWGLSAAGYLDPEIFRFFQEYGIELMSGFGMTEATGGITMTAPFQYCENSVGPALPGIDIELAKDGEMKMRGPYVMMGYLNEKSNGIEDGWVYTGDIFSKDANGSYEIIDRKKEIYKNIKGQTVSPQKIENLFRDFESVQSVFLVGDHREHNTLLLYPNFEYEQVNFKKLKDEELREFFNSLIVSVNRFLAPFERIVNFDIIDRDFDIEKGELTPKGTYKRKAIEKNFADIIKSMYGKKYIAFKINKLELRVPKWFLRVKGLTSDDLRLKNSTLSLKQFKKKLKIKSANKDTVQIGSLWYSIPNAYFNLGKFINTPDLWVGNLEFENFVGEVILQRSLERESKASDIKVLPKKTDKGESKILNELKNLIKKNEFNLRGIHLSAHAVHSLNKDHAFPAIEYLGSVIQAKSGQTSRIAASVLMRTCEFKDISIKRRAFGILLATEKRIHLEDIIQNFLRPDELLLDKKMILALSQQGFGKDQLEQIFSFLKNISNQLTSKKKSAFRKIIISIFDLLTAYGARHSSSYKKIRAEFIQWSLSKLDAQVSKHAKMCAEKLLSGYRKWIGPNQLFAVDSDTGAEYRWQDVITCEESIHVEDKKKILTALEKAPVIREAISVFTNSKTLIRLEDIAHKGIWVSFLGARHGKSVYRISVQTRRDGAFDLAINVNQNLSKKEVENEISWLIRAGVKETPKPLVEDFGGYWPEYDLWTEEFIHGETVDKVLARLERQDQAEGTGKLPQFWPHFAWSGLLAYVDFWHRTDLEFEIADPTPANVIVPLYDFQFGSRIVSISNRKNFESLAKMMLSFRTNFILKVESKYTQLRGQSSWHIIFSAFVEILGEKGGLEILAETVTTLENSKLNQDERELLQKLKIFTQAVQEKGYLPRRLYFAIKRFHRWLDLNRNATTEARLQNLQELMTTYTLNDLEKRYPGVRVQLFRDTVFEKNKDIKCGLNKTVQEIHANLNSNIDLLGAISKLKSQTSFSEEESFFLTRMTYPHLGPKDTAKLISLSEHGTPTTTLIVFIEDQEGHKLGIRRPASAKEIAKLHKLYTMANLPIEFRPEHQYLIVVNERLQVIGGIFYRFIEPQNVHLEKIVVDNRYRKKGVSNGLMQEFFNRLKNQEVKIVTVGFLRPEFFYRFGFKIEHSYGNMVKRLIEGR